MKNSWEIQATYTNCINSIGPIQIDHSHWGGWHLTIEHKQAEWIKKACETYEKTVPYPKSE